MLNPSLDIPALAQQFRLRNRIQVKNILLPEVAERLYQCLEHEVPWGVAFLDGTEPKLLQADEVAKFSPTDWQTLHRRIQTTPPENFQFLYHSYMMVTAYIEKRNPGLPLHQAVEYINGNIFLELLKNISGITNIIKADAQATRYVSGCYLKRHNDMGTGDERQLAYVINLTKNWRADWGGLLQFLTEDGEVSDTFYPAFNSMTLFKVPMFHHVSYVAPYAAHGRYAITGWGMSR